MKKILYLSAIITALFFSACKNEDKKDADDKLAPIGTQADSLMADVMDGHDVGMAKMSKIRFDKAAVSRVLDSIGKLPEKAKQGLAPLKSKLDELLVDLNNAENSMNQWMSEFDMDSAKDNAQKRIDYLLNEKIKIGKVKEAILSGLAKTDSLLKKNF